MLLLVPNQTKSQSGLGIDKRTVGQHWLHHRRFLYLVESGQAETELSGLTWLHAPARCNTGSQRIFFPNADSASSTASDAVRLCSSMTGLTSTISKLSRRPWSAMISIARWASR